MGADADLCFTPATVLAGMIRTKQVSPVEVTEAVLDRIATLEPTLNAFATLAADQAMVAARAAEAAVVAGAALGPLHGVPVTLKDLTWTKSIKTESGSFTRQGFVPPVDAPVATRLREAGSILLGKTTTSEFGWKGVSQSPLTGITHNPWGHGLNAGASSAGAAVASASGYGPLHQGSDGAGSIRMPAHFCGIFGLKPTYGRVPTYPVSTGDYTSHTGPMTRTVADSALMLRVMAGPHPLDHTCCEATPPDYVAALSASMKGKRIAFSPDLGHARVDPEVASLVDAAVKVFADLGAHVEQITPAWGPQGPDIVRFFWPAHISANVVDLPKFESRMDPGLLACIQSGLTHSLVDYQLMRAKKYAYCAAINSTLDEWDYLITPAVSVKAFPAELLMPTSWPNHAWDWVSWAEFSYPFNMSGNPAASVPCGFTPDALPVGLQIVGKRFDDLGVLQASAAFESARPWAGKKPN